VSKALLSLNCVTWGQSLSEALLSLNCVTWGQSLSKALLCLNYRVSYADSRQRFLVMAQSCDRVLGQYSSADKNWLHNFVVVTAERCEVIYRLTKVTSQTSYYSGFKIAPIVSYL
jgi:hypothetical protein